jgi:hypothetical protein
MIFNIILGQFDRPCQERLVGRLGFESLPNLEGEQDLGATQNGVSLLIILPKSYWQ